MGFNLETSGQVESIAPLMQELNSIFNLTPWLFLVPALVIFLIVKKMPALPAILIGTLAEALFAFIFQQDVLQHLNGGALDFKSGYKILMQALTVDVNYNAEHPILAELLSSSGMAGMLGTVWLIISAMVFGGAMEACGFLETLSAALLKLAKGTTSLVATTAGTCLALNVTASDQYLAIVVPGRMYADAYRKRGLAPENLSRTLEDSGTVTSVLVPYNTCGAYQSTVLGVDTLAYLPYAFFNYFSPIITILYAALDIKIRRLTSKDAPVILPKEKI